MPGCDEDGVCCSGEACCWAGKTLIPCVRFGVGDVFDETVACSFVIETSASSGGRWVQPCNVQP